MISNTHLVSSRVVGKDRMTDCFMQLFKLIGPRRMPFNGFFLEHYSFSESDCCTPAFLIRKHRAMIAGRTGDGWRGGRVSSDLINWDFAFRRPPGKWARTATASASWCDTLVRSEGPLRLTELSSSVGKAKAIPNKSFLAVVIVGFTKRG